MPAFVRSSSAGQAAVRRPLVVSLFLSSCLLSVVSWYTTQQGMALYLSPWFSLLASLGVQSALVMVAWLIGVTRSGRALLTAVYAITAVVSIGFSYVSLHTWFAARERPATPPCPPGLEARSLVFDGFKSMFRQPNFVLLLVIFFIGLGAFNAVTTWIEDILRPNGFTSTQAGIVGGLMIVGGILGAVVLPTLSDKLRRRTPFILIALAGATVGLAGIAFAASYWLLMVSSFMMGFFLLSAGPIGFQYGAETTYPTPEGTSNGLLILMGQISGIAFIFAMDSFRSPATGSMTSSLVVLIVLMVVSLALAFFLKEPKILLSGASKPDEAALAQESAMN